MPSHQISFPSPGPQFNPEITTNLRTTCGGGLNLIWNQPHPIYLAELEYRAAATEQARQDVLERYGDVVTATADFMAVRWRLLLAVRWGGGGDRGGQGG